MVDYIMKFNSEKKEQIIEVLKCIPIELRQYAAKLFGKTKSIEDIDKFTKKKGDFIALHEIPYIEDIVTEYSSNYPIHILVNYRGNLDKIIEIMERLSLSNRIRFAELIGKVIKLDRYNKSYKNAIILETLTPLQCGGEYKNIKYE